MASEQTFVIVGASLAGAMAAEALRSEGFDGRVVLIGEEAQRPYERLADGSRMPYSRLLLSTGALPRRLPLPGTELPGVRYLRSMGDADALRAAIGAAVVDGFRRTSAPDIFAAGDVAATWNPMYNKHIRMEHWANALNQGPAAARNMLGQHTAYREASVLLLRPVRPRHGVPRLRLGLGPRGALR